MRLSVPILISLMLAAGFAAGQAPIFKVAQRGGAIPFNYDFGYLSVADFNGDGCLDLFENCSENPNRIYFNDGKGAFTEGGASCIPQADDKAYNQGVAVGDVDGDKDIDIVICRNTIYSRNPNPACALWLNDGQGAFTPAAAFPKFQANCVLMADVDKDGDLDLVFGTMGALADPVNYPTHRLLLNDGKGTFTDASATHMPMNQWFAFASAAGDVDGDGDPDLVFGHFNYNVGVRKGNQDDHLYLNDGTGRFKDAGPIYTPATPFFTRGLTLGDVDGDKRLDLFVTKFYWDTTPHELYLGDGKGGFAPAPAGMFPAIPTNRTSRSFVLVDLDKDGDLDVFAPMYQGGGLFLNDGKGWFTDVTAQCLSIESVDVRSGVFGDFDADGDLDLAAMSLNQARLYVNDGKLKFTCCVQDWIDRVVDGPEVGELGDLDGDGAPDLILANSGAYSWWRDQVTIFMNDRTGRFSIDTTGRIPAATNYGYGTCIAIGDLNGDGWNDFIAGKDSDLCRLYLNNGKGFFADATATNFPAIITYVWGLELGDVDGDKDLDVVVAVWGGQDRLLLNNGKGVFTDVTATHLPQLPNSGSRGLALGDIDRDGDLDLVVGHFGGQSYLFLNNGKGIFTDVTATNLPAGLYDTMDVALGDLNGDGHLDLVLGNGLPTPVPSLLYFNDGKGVFKDASSQLPTFNGITEAVLLQDFNNDGHLDIYLAVMEYYIDEGKSNRIWLNNGKGRFTEATSGLALCHDHSNWATAGDVDGDGDIDVVAINYYSQILNLNLYRHVWGPKLARLGTTYEYEVFSGQPNPSLRWVWPFISSGLLPKPQAIPTIGNLLRIDPFLAVFLGTVNVDPVLGKAAVKVYIPKDPVLLGVKFYLQAIIPGNAGYHFSNLFSDRIVE